MITTTLEKYLAIAVAVLIGSGALAGWWALHNHKQQAIGAAACMQATTVDKTEAHADAVSTQAAQAVDINAVVKGYEDKVISLQRNNDDLAKRLLTSGALRPHGVPDPGSAACANAADAGLDGGKGKAQSGPPAEQLRADLDRLLAAGDANQVKTEDCAKLYNGVRDRAIAAAAKLPTP